MRLYGLIAYRASWAVLGAFSWCLRLWCALWVFALGAVWLCGLIFSLVLAFWLSVGVVVGVRGVKSITGVF